MIPVPIYLTWFRRFNSHEKHASAFLSGHEQKSPLTRTLFCIYDPTGNRPAFSNSLPLIRTLDATRRQALAFARLVYRLRRSIPCGDRITPKNPMLCIGFKGVMTPRGIEPRFAE